MTERYPLSKLTWLSRPTLLKTLLAQARLALRLLRDPRVPAAVKAVPALGLLYFVSPLDFIPDVFPILGQVDDLAIVVLALEGFLRLCPHGPRAFHEHELAQGRPYSPMDFIDAEWRQDS